MEDKKQNEKDQDEEGAPTEEVVKAPLESLLYKPRWTKYRYLPKQDRRPSGGWGETNQPS